MDRLVPIPRPGCSGSPIPQNEVCDMLSSVQSHATVVIPSTLVQQRSPEIDRLGRGRITSHEVSEFLLR